MRGRKPIPRELKVLKGSSGGRRIAERPAPETGLPDCPDWLDNAAKDEWLRVAPELAALGLLTQIDCMALAAYCQTYARWKSAELTIAAEGMFHTDHKGVMRQHPATRVAESLLKQIRSFAVEFGFTPSSRGRIEAPPPPNKETDALEEYLK